MKILAYVVAIVIAIALVIVGIGYALPVNHTASLERVYAAPASRVFEAISSPSEFPLWRSDVTGVDMLPDEAGRRSFREVGKDGSITYVVEESEPGSRLVTRIAGDDLPFGGTWTYELTPQDGGTSLRITEDGEVYNPIYRFMSRFVFGHHATMKKYLDDLGQHLKA